MYCVSTSDDPFDESIDEHDKPQSEGWICVVREISIRLFALL